MYDYNQIIFSDYLELDKLIEHNYNPKKYNAFFDVPYNNYFHFGLRTDEIYYSDFEKKFNSPSNLTHLTFGCYFNCSVKLSENLIKLTFGDKFNQHIILPEKITHLIFGIYFNKPIILPSKLTYITFGDEFNQPITLPEKITNIKFGKKFNQPVNFPMNLLHLTLGVEFNQPITLPNIKYLSLANNMNYIVDYRNQIIFLY